jgi:4-amino-4-deoxy-L-arabinose transferase-like glycosyltransferase
MVGGADPPCQGHALGVPSYGMFISSHYLRRFAVVVALAAALCMPWLARPFHTRGEPREALVAQAMLVTGNWISPPAYDGAVPSKPPFSHWLISLASLPSGEVTELTSRLPSALAVVLFSGAFFWFLVRRLSLSAATGASLILLASSEWFRSASTCRVDTLLATSLAGALLALYRWWESHYRGIPWFAIVLTSCAALTKGPVGIVLPLGLFSLFCWVRVGFRGRGLVGIALRAAMVSVPVVAIASVWYLLGYLERGEAFIEKIRYENFERFTSAMADEPHKHSMFYLVGMLAVGLLPWSLCFVTQMAPQRFLTCWRGQRCGENLSRWWRERSPLHQYSWIVSFGIVLFFCIPSSKRSVYLLPAYPFLAIILEGGLRRVELNYPQIFNRVSLFLIWALGAILVAALVVCIVPVAGVKLDIDSLWQSMTMSKLVATALLCGLLGIVLRSTVTELVGQPLERLAIVVVTVVFVVSFFVYDVVAWQLSPKRWVRSGAIQRELHAEPVPRLFSYGSEAYGASFYLKLPFARATPGDVPDGSLVFVEQGKLAEFKAKVAPQVEEILRYSSGLSAPKRDIVVGKVLPRSLSQNQ